MYDIRYTKFYVEIQYSKGIPSRFKVEIALLFRYLYEKMNIFYIGPNLSETFRMYELYLFETNN